MNSCPCRSGLDYADCCGLLHRQPSAAADAHALMRSRYAAYVVGYIDYIAATTVPAQQPLLDTAAMAQWSRDTHWTGLQVHAFRTVGKQHAQVEFSACFTDAAGAAQEHRELSAFVCIDGQWFFIDPTVPLPGMKHACICGSGKKFKQCCGQFFR